MIKNKKEFTVACRRLDAILATTDRVSEDYRRLVADVQQYETQHCTEPLPPDPVDAILFRADQEGRINPCASCGHDGADHTHMVHRDTNVPWFQLWCPECGFSSDLYHVSVTEALADWNSLWETKA